MHKGGIMSTQEVVSAIEQKAISKLMDPMKYDYVVGKLRDFFRGKLGFVEVPTQHRLSILAACENPFNVTQMIYHGQTWPLPQTGQMWLEYELLRNPSVPGYYCISTSYRDEPSPEADRHDLIFQMFEFEMLGNMDAMRLIEEDLLNYLGFGDVIGEYPTIKYTEAMGLLSLQHGEEIESKHELTLQRIFGDALFLTHFPEFTDPFWNMKRDEDIAKKIDVLIHGMETIGSSERSCDPKEMRNNFYYIKGGDSETEKIGRYAKALFQKFTRERVEEELEQFLNFDFMPRSGGGIGLNRLIRGMEISDLIPNFS